MVAVMPGGQSPLSRVFGPRGSQRRRRLKALPLVGKPLRRAVHAYRDVREYRVRAQLSLKDTLTDFKNRHTRTAGNITRRNTRRAYDRVYADDRLLDEYLAPERLAFYQAVAGVAASLPTRSVVDVGCGTGNLLHELVARTPIERVVGIDYAPAGVRRASRLVPAGEFHAASLYDLQLDETFDLVLCTEVLEHVPDPSRAAERLVELCAEGGAILITVPDGASDTWKGHLSFWSQAELGEFLGQYGEVEVRRVQADLMAILRPRRIQ